MISPAAMSCGLGFPGGSDSGDGGSGVFSGDTSGRILFPLLFSGRVAVTDPKVEVCALFLCWD